MFDRILHLPLNGPIRLLETKLSPKILLENVTL